MTIVRRFCSQTTDLWKDVFKEANTRLINKHVKIEFSNLPISQSLKTRGYRLLEIHTENGREPIDVFRVPPTDWMATAGKLIQKATQHLNSRNTPGILISRYGKKLDIRGLSPNRRIQMDKIDGSLLINDRKITVDFMSCSTQDEDRDPISSLTICRAVENLECVEFFDDENIENPLEQIPLLVDIETSPRMILNPLDTTRLHIYKEILKHRKP